MSLFLTEHYLILALLDQLLIAKQTGDTNSLFAHYMAADEPDRVKMFAILVGFTLESFDSEQLEGLVYKARKKVDRYIEKMFETGGNEK